MRMNKQMFSFQLAFLREIGSGHVEEREQVEKIVNKFKNTPLLLSKFLLVRVI